MTTSKPAGGVEAEKARLRLFQQRNDWTQAQASEIWGMKLSTYRQRLRLGDRVMRNIDYERVLGRLGEHAEAVVAYVRDGVGDPPYIADEITPETVGLPAAVREKMAAQEANAVLAGAPFEDGAWVPPPVLGREEEAPGVTRYRIERGTADQRVLSNTVVDQDGKRYRVVIALMTYTQEE